MTRRFDIPGLLGIALILAVATTSGRAAERPGSPPHGGYFSSREDSLGYDAYRDLDRDAQLERRDKAERWIRRTKEIQHLAASQAERDSVGGILERALDACATAVGLCPYLPEGWLRYTEILNQLGYYDSAEICAIHAESTLAYEPRESRRKQLEGDLHRQRANVAYNRGRWEQSEQEAAAAMDIVGDDDDLAILRARSLSALGRYDEARALLAEVDEGPAQATALSVLGLVEMAAGNLDAASAAFDRAAQRGLRGAVFSNDRGRLALARGDLVEAEKDFQEAALLLPTFMEARSNLAVTYRRAGRLDEAEGVLEDLLRDRPSYAAGHFNLAEVLREQMKGLDPAAQEAKARSALKHYSRALALGFDPERVVTRRASLAAGTANLDMAEEDLLRLADDPDMDPEVLHRLGRVKRDQGKFEIAQKLFEMAIDRGAHGAILYSDLGGVLLAQSQFDAARQAFEQALSRNPDLLVTRVNLSIAYMELGDIEKAAQVLGPALQKAPSNASVQSQRAQLERLGAEFD